MWNYYGSKASVVRFYPKPLHNKIIEPFAGAAKYSLSHFENDVTLVDKYQVVIDVWHYLQAASEKDILGLPHLKRGDSLNNYPLLSDIEKLFLGFLVCNGLPTPRVNVGSFEGVDVLRDLKKIASNLFKIRHWKIVCDTYENIPNEQATWFIDPPYMYGGQHYKESNKNINFQNLATWCKSRDGQVMVCENTKADWLPFAPVAKMNGQIHTTTEAIWCNYKTQFDNKQIQLF